MRDGDLYTAVKLKDMASGELESFDTNGAVIETYEKSSGPIAQ